MKLAYHFTNWQNYCQILRCGFLRPQIHQRRESENGNANEYDYWAGDREKVFFSILDDYSSADCVFVFDAFILVDKYNASVGIDLIGAYGDLKRSLGYSHDDLIQCHKRQSIFRKYAKDIQRLRRVTYSAAKYLLLHNPNAQNLEVVVSGLVAVKDAHWYGEKRLTF